jgi:hypothetical protein
MMQIWPETKVDNCGGVAVGRETRVHPLETAPCYDSLIFISVADATLNGLAVPDRHER